MLEKIGKTNTHSAHAQCPVPGVWHGGSEIGFGGTASSIMHGTGVEDAGISATRTETATRRSHIPVCRHTASGYHRGPSSRFRNADQTRCTYTYVREMNDKIYGGGRTEDGRFTDRPNFRICVDPGI